MTDVVEVATEVAKQVPALVVLAVIVRWFLQAMRAMMRENEEARKHSLIIIELNTKALAENTVACKQMTKEFSSMGLRCKPSEPSTQI